MYVKSRRELSAEPFPVLSSARVSDPAVRATEGLRISAPYSARVSDPAVCATEGLRIAPTQVSITIDPPNPSARIPSKEVPHVIPIAAKKLNQPGRMHVPTASRRPVE